MGSSANKMSAKTKLTILFSILGILIVGVIIAIIIVVVNRNNSKTSNSNDGTGTSVEESTGEVSDKEVVESYEEIGEEITMKIIEAQETGDGSEGARVELLLSLLEEKIESVKNEKIKAMLAMDYYMARLAQNPGEDAKDEIMNGLFNVDDILKTSDSAFAVMNAAIYFGDQDLKDKYYAIGMERAAAEDASRTTEDNTENNDSGEEETVG